MFNNIVFASADRLEQIWYTIMFWVCLKK